MNAISPISPVAKVVDSHDRLTNKPKVRQYVIDVDAKMMQPAVTSGGTYKRLDSLLIVLIRELK